jgi:hypothetical protein
LKRVRDIRSPFQIDAPSQKIPSEDFIPYSADTPRKTGGFQFQGTRAIELIKWEGRIR